MYISILVLLVVFRTSRLTVVRNSRFVKCLIFQLNDEFDKAVNIRFICFGDG